MAGENNSIVAGIKRYVIQPANVVLFRKGRNVTEHTLPDFFTAPEFSHLHNVHEYAVFSHAVYGEITSKHVQEGKCRIDIPKNWQPMENLSGIPENRGSIDIGGLRYHVWENPLENKVVLAFRGTRFTRLNDWYANFNFITRFVPGVRNHYGKVKDFIPGFVEEVHDRLGMDVEIITTGHSLGGGLAQLCAYLSPHINCVYAFASSPVTGYRSVKKEAREVNQLDTRITRIFEHGEVLAYLRFFLRKIVTLSTKNPEINEVRFNFSESGLISEHSMGKLAENIINVSPPADSNLNYENIA